VLSRFARFRERPAPSAVRRLAVTEPMLRFHRRLAISKASCPPAACACRQCRPRPMTVGERPEPLASTYTNAGSLETRWPTAWSIGNFPEKMSHCDRYLRSSERNRSINTAGPTATLTRSGARRELRQLVEDERMQLGTSLMRGRLRSRNDRSGVASQESEPARSVNPHCSRPHVLLRSTAAPLSL
jgi:hypothetical protein